MNDKSIVVIHQGKTIESIVPNESTSKTIENMAMKNVDKTSRINSEPIVVIYHSKTIESIVPNKSSSKTIENIVLFESNLNRVRLENN